MLAVVLRLWRRGRMSAETDTEDSEHDRADNDRETDRGETPTGLLHWRRVAPGGQGG